MIWWYRLERYFVIVLGVALAAAGSATYLYTIITNSDGIFGFTNTDLINGAQNILMFAAGYAAFIAFVLFVAKPRATQIKRRQLGRFVYGIPIAILILLNITLWLYGTLTENRDFVMYAEVSLLLVAGPMFIFFVVRPAAAVVFNSLLAWAQKRQAKLEKLNTERTKQNTERNT